MVKTIQIDHLQIGGRHRPVFIAEIGINYKTTSCSNQQMAYNLTDACIEAGADIIKTQLHYPKFEMLPNHPWFSLMEECALNMVGLQIFWQN